MSPTILLVGFDLVGRRHFWNLRALGVGNLCVYRTGKSTWARRLLKRVNAATYSLLYES